MTLLTSTLDTAYILPTCLAYNYHAASIFSHLPVSCFVLFPKQQYLSAHNLPFSNKKNDAQQSSSQAVESCSLKCFMPIQYSSTCMVNTNIAKNLIPHKISNFAPEVDFDLEFSKGTKPRKNSAKWLCV